MPEATVFQVDIIQTAVTKAIFDSMTEEGRTALIMGALEHITKQVPGRYSTDPATPSPLEMAFRSQVGIVVNQMVAEFVSTDERLRQELHNRILEAASEILTQKTQLREAIASAFSTAMDRLW